MSDPETREIDRVEAPTREEFEQNYVNRRKPCILTGVADKWKAFSDWDPEYLKGVAGDSEVTVHFEESGNYRDWYNTQVSERSDKRMTLSALLDILHAEPPDRRYYMTEHDLHLISEALLDDLSMSDLISDRLVPGVSSGPCLFLGRDTCMPMHYHATTQAFMCQLHGSKKLTLYGPEDFRRIYPRRWYQEAFVFSRIDGKTQRSIADHEDNGIDYDKHPRLKGASPLQFVVEPGEVLFIPVHWWHLTSAAGFQISVTYFWQHKQAPYHYPSPGLQVFAHEVLAKSKRRLKSLRARIRGRTAPAPGQGSA